ncbi:MAG: serine hydrolase domain-containing protein, partial [Propionicimonas sp.]|nr:serine hydrolase domain-containing protein [Propionicimonas sp.]
MDAGALAADLARRSHGFPAALALLTPDGDHLVTHRCTTGSSFEIGSITKGVTGLLYHDALARGEVTPDTRLGDLLPVGEGPVAGIRLADLATHRSGLPRVLVSHNLRRSWDYLRRGTNPYAGPVDELFELARTARLRRPGRPSYSNAGFQLFGHALAAAVPLDYPDLVASRIAG